MANDLVSKTSPDSGKSETANTEFATPDLVVDKTTDFETQWDMENRPVNVAVYARVSTKDQSCEQQLTELRAYVQARGWTLVGEFVDKMSGTKDTRPAMRRVMEAAQRRAIDAVLVSKMDRWGRSMPNFIATVQELRELGVRFIVPGQGIDTDERNPASKLMFNMLVAFSDFERELIVERTIAGLQRARKNGSTLGRPKIVIDRAKVAKLAADGLSMRAIAEKLGVSAAKICRVLNAG